MISKSQISVIKSLSVKKYRSQEKLFVAEGHKIVSEVLKSRFPVKWLVASTQWIEENKALISDFYSVLIETDEAEMKKISNLSTPSPVLAVLNMPELPKLSIEINGIVLVLDEIQDPGNMGTILRICDWFGISNVVCSQNCADAFSPKVIQAGMGAFLRVFTHYTCLTEYITEYIKTTSNKVYGTFLEGTNIYKAQLSNNGLIIMGNEGKGIKPEIEKLISDKLFIPVFAKNNAHAESLNVSTATAIVCSEFARRTMKLD